jgi:transposase
MTEKQSRKHGTQAPVVDDGWRIPDALWQRIEPLLPPRKPHPLGCHNPRVADRKAMDAIFFVLRTGCQWGALSATGICSKSSAHRRFQEWSEAGVFAKLWEQGLLEYDELKGLDWQWLAMDGAMTKAPLGGEKDGQKPYRPRQTGGQAESAGRGQRHPRGPGHRRCQPA